jgi:ATP-dependent helicase/nuclease subunit B
MPLKETLSSVFSISPHIPFLPELAHFIFERANKFGGIESLPHFKILLPSRRAARALQFECLKLSDRPSLIMPQFLPIGDVDEDELDLSLLALSEGASDSLNLPNVISPIDRRLWLSDLIAKTDPSLSKAQCLDFAKSLARFMDQVHTENLNLSDLNDLVLESDLAQHWQKTVEFLGILSTAWPIILQEAKVIEPSDRRNRLLTMLANTWRDHPPTYPIIAAGSTGSIPAVATLLTVISQLPNGSVILPGLDIDMQDKIWDAISLSHPQATMKNLLNVMNISRDQVQNLNYKSIVSSSPSLLRDMLCPSEYFLNIKTVSREDFETSIKTIHFIKAEHERDEAQAIALILREVVETPNKTAMVVTPDRNMARRISAELKRWNIDVNDSAGQGLHTTHSAVLVKKLLSFVSHGFLFKDFLGILHSPHVKDQFPSEELFNFEQEYFFKNLYRPAKVTKQLLLELSNKYLFLNDSIVVFQKLLDIKSERIILKDYIESIVNAMQDLAAHQTNFWDSDHAKAMALYLQNLMASEVASKDMSVAEAEDIIEHFWSETMVRASDNPHPNITILGQIEARLLKADVMILAGLNEGVWPQDPITDPWMSRPMREQFGLPSSERQFALSAHDFVQNACADTVYITRSLRMNGVPTIPARWLQRLEAYLLHYDIKIEMLENKFRNFIRPMINEFYKIDTVKPIQKPMPSPPEYARPNEFFVTEIETLIRNPYQYYAQSILRLRPLREVNEDSDLADTGNVLHEIFAEYLEQTKESVPENADQILYTIFDQYQEKMQNLDGGYWQFFWRVSRKLIPSFIKLDTYFRTEGQYIQSETKAKAPFMITGKEINLRAKPDRIDAWGQSGLTILDYKTGKAPSVKDTQNGTKPQLPLEVLMASKGAFFNNIPHTMRAAFWHIPNKKTYEMECQYLEDDDTIDTIIENTEREFINLVELIINPSTPFIVTPTKYQMFSSEEKIHHLARSDEWGLFGELKEDDHE